MPWLLPSVIASLCGSIILVLVFAFLFFQYRERHMGIWAWGWFFYALRFFLVLCSLHGWWVLEMPHLIQFCVLTSGLLLLWGTNEFVKKKTSSLWIFGGVFGVTWIIISHLSQAPFLVQTLPVFFFYAAISIWTGVLFLCSQKAEGPGKYLTGWTFILWGIHKADYPFLRPVEWFAPWGFLLGGVLGLAVAMGMLLVYFQKVRTSLQEKEARLRESWDHYRTLLETIPHGIIETDADGRITYVNEAYCRMKGLGLDEIKGKYGWELVALPGARRMAQEKFAKVKAGETHPDTDMTKNLDQDGRDVWRQLDWNYIRCEQDVVTGYIAVVTDITQRKQAEEALRESEYKYRKLSQEFQVLLDGIPDALILLGPEMQVVWANKGTAALHDRDHFELPGLPYDQLWSGEAPCCESYVRKTFQTGEPTETLERTSDGRSWGCKNFPIKDKDGHVVNVIQLASDMTEKIRLREQATQASRLAALGELAAGVAHEINNPNGQMLLNLPLVAEAIEDSLPILESHFQQQGDFPWGGLRYSRMRQEIPRLVDEMQDASQRIKRIVDDLRNFSRKESSEQLRPVDLNKALATAVRLAGNSIKRTTDHFQVSYEDDLPPIRGIQQRIEQVLVNLILNACQALPDRSSSLAFGTSYDRINERSLVVVQDEGGGMEQEVLEHITDPFFTTRREVGGTGLGLSISTQILKEHSGELLFDSAPGKGTTVTVSLPVLR